ncbi:hypothetical protein HS7_01050 [Sulfolobales archaeon HS-7]|nr:hypothetical protein HS7_01050 [Sulfolobales archaeon HS-7]
MSQFLRGNYDLFRYYIVILLIVWAILHFILAISYLNSSPVLGDFFIFDSLLAIIAAVVVYLDVRLLYIPVIVYSWINYLLLAESRYFPAPVLGYPLRVIGSFAVATFAIDVALIVLTLLIWLASRRIGNE